jgi:hypothetical protein
LEALQAAFPALGSAESRATTSNLPFWPAPNDKRALHRTLAPTPSSEGRVGKPVFARKRWWGKIVVIEKLDLTRECQALLPNE